MNTKVVSWIFLITLTFSAFSKEPLFITGKWSEVLEKARREHKIIFVDVYTTWCAPCRQMESTVFTDPIVKEVFSQYFIPYKFDAEEFTEGMDLAQKFRIKSFPTTVYVDPSTEKAIFRKDGISTVDMLLSEARQVIEMINPAEVAQNFMVEYAGGDKSPDFLLKTIQLRREKGMPESKLVDEYLNMLEYREQTSPTNLRLIGECTGLEPDGISMDILISNKDKIAKLLGDREKVELLIAKTIKRGFEKAIEDKNQRLFNRMLNLNKEISPQHYEEVNLLYSIEFYKNLKDGKNYSIETHNYITNYILELSVETIQEKDKQALEKSLEVYKHGELDSLAENSTYASDKELYKDFFSKRISDYLETVLITYIDIVPADPADDSILNWVKRMLELKTTPEKIEVAKKTLTYLGKNAEEWQKIIQDLP